MDHSEDEHEAAQHSGQKEMKQGKSGDDSHSEDETETGEVHSGGDEKVAVGTLLVVFFTVGLWWMVTYSVQHMGLQSGPKVLDHSGVFIRDFHLSRVLMLLHNILARTRHC